MTRNRKFTICILVAVYLMPLAIYAPIVALTTLSVLLVQVGLQKEINDHQYAQAHLSQARSDVEFYALQLVEKLEFIGLPGQTYRSILHRNFQPTHIAELDSEALRTLAQNIDFQLPSVIGMWSCVYPVFAGLSANDTPIFRSAFGSAQQKLIALLSFETCVTLDNFYRVRTKGQLDVIYKFSPLLSV